MLKKAFVLAMLAAVALPSIAAGATTERIMPGVKYLREKRQVGGASVLFHVVLGPKPGGLYGLRPVLSNERVTGLETLSSMQRRQLPRANVVGVNADLFTAAYGYPNSIFVRNGVLASRPLRGRSSLGIGLDGILRIAQIAYAGSFQIGGANVRNLKEFNRPLGVANGFTLFVPSWGARTPRRSHTKEAILADVRRTVPNRDRTARIVKVVRGSRHSIPAGGAVLQARGTSRPLLTAEAAASATLTFRLGLSDWWDGVDDAIGGGPELVRGGVAVYRPHEWFSSYQLNQRHPRTAVGQLGDGRILLLTADGRSSSSAGLTNTQLAKAMVHYGAERAIAFDGGGSAEMAFNGNVLNRPSDGRERSLANSLQLFYIGAYARKPRREVFSPNGDGYQDAQRLYAKFVRTSNVHLELVRPDGIVRWDYDALRRPGTITKDMKGTSLPEGTWEWIVAGVDLKDRGSRMVRRFRVDNTLGFLTLSTRHMEVKRRRGGHLRIGFQLAHTADVTVTVRRPSGRLVRRLVSQSGLAPGGYAVIWDGRNKGGKVVRSGTFVVVVHATNGLGAVDLRKSVLVTRVS